MIIGIGTDIQIISDFEKKKNNNNLLKKLFTEKELSILEKKSTKSYVGFFCAKEATAKALGTGFRNFMPTDIEVLNDSYGKPFITLRNKALELSQSLNISTINVSISHSGDYCVAFVICESSCI